MPSKKIIIGADHRGFQLKSRLITELRSRGYDVIDKGDTKLDSEDDYPQFASRVVRELLDSEKSATGILICGSGQGMAMTANRHKGIRAAVVWNKEQARLARNDDDANVLALPADVFEDDIEGAIRIIEIWLSTPFESIARRTRRISQMDEL